MILGKWDVAAEAQSSAVWNLSSGRHPCLLLLTDDGPVAPVPAHIPDAALDLQQ